VKPRFLQEQIERLSGLVSYPVGETARVARRELAAALNTAATEYQASYALTVLIREEERRFCPTPGEIIAAVLATPEKDPKSKKSATQCNRCQGSGFAVRHFRMPDYPHGPREYISAEEEEQIRRGAKSSSDFYSDAARCSHGGGK
jgi:hypothetical protein